MTEEVMLDASVFSSPEHCEEAFEAYETTGQKFRVSAALYKLVYDEVPPSVVVGTLGMFGTSKRFLKHLSDNRDSPFSYLMELKPTLEPYQSNPEYVKELIQYPGWQDLPPIAEKIVFDEYSFLREHSSIVMRTRALAKFLKKRGISVLEKPNDISDIKKLLFRRFRGARWLVGIVVALAAIPNIANNPALASIIGLGNYVLVVTDPPLVAVLQ